MARRIQREQGFTLIELMLVVAIIGVLAAVAMVSYQHFTEKAKGVEAEVALAEVNRLEQLHHANHGSYSSDLNAIGFSLASALKFYKIEVRIHSGGAGFQAMALPLVRSGAQQIALALSRAPDGRITQTKGDPMTLAAQLGSASSGSGNSIATPTEAGGAISGGGGDQPKPNCKEGGEATVASDGLLDNNFCLQSTTNRSR